MKATLLAAVIPSLLLLSANSNLLFGQTTNCQITLSPPSHIAEIKLDKSSTNETTQTPKYLSQLRRAQESEASFSETVTNAIGGEVDNLEWTGEYAERYVRVPEGNSGKAKLIRFLIPVYREKGTHRKASVGTEDKEWN